MGSILSTENDTKNDTFEDVSEITETVIVVAQTPDHVMQRLSQLEARLGRLETSGAPAPIARPTTRAPTRRSAPPPNWHGELVKVLQDRREKIHVD